VTAPRQARAFSPEAIREIAGHPSLSVAPTVEDALERALKAASDDDAVFVTGSLFLVAEARAMLVRQVSRLPG
jgi:folylpolyglutamate synthase/dihydropteroate synthase